MVELSAADWILLNYATDTSQGASGAVRRALSSGRPVAVSRAPIFDDVREAVHTIGDGPLAPAIAGLFNDQLAQDARARAQAVLRNAQLAQHRAPACRALQRSSFEKEVRRVIVIDVRYIRERPSGISPYAQALVDHLPLLAPQREFLFLKHPKAPARLSSQPNTHENRGSVRGQRTRHDVALASAGRPLASYPLPRHVQHPAGRARRCRSSPRYTT